MKRPSGDFLSDEIASHLDNRTLAILAEAEAFQDWDREQQLTLDEIPREDSTAILGWLNAVFAAGNMKYGDRWSAHISIDQAHSRLTREDKSEAAQELRNLYDKREAVIQSILAIVSPDDRLDPLFEADAMAGERITTLALFASIQDRDASTDSLVKMAVEQIKADILGR
jgi:hypothetical protein